MNTIQSKRLGTILHVAMCMLMMIVIAGCEKNPPNETVSAPKAQTVGFVVTTLSNPFFVDMVEGARQEAKIHGNLEVLVQAPERASDNERQIQLIENLITRHVDLICIVPADSKSVLAAILKANAARIPVIVVDNKVDSEAASKSGAQIAGYIGSDNFSGGKLAGEFIVSKLSGQGKVAILEGVSGVEAGIKRRDGFLSAVKQSPGIQVVASQPADWDREKGLNVFQAMLQAHPDLKGLFACNDEMALGAIRALRTPRPVVVVGFDATKDAVEAVGRGELDATVAQVPGDMGRAAVRSAVRVLAGAKIEPTQETPLKLIVK